MRLPPVSEGERRSDQDQDQIGPASYDKPWSGVLSVGDAGLEPTTSTV